MKSQKLLLFILSLFLVLTFIPVPSFATTEPSSVQTNTESGNQGDISPSTSFSDMSGHWAAKAVEKWAKFGVVKGDSKGFRPNDPISRAEMAVILDNLMGYQKTSANIFSDVPSNAWYADAVLKANTAGILGGDGKGHASPTSEITREQAAVMLARAFGVDENAGNDTAFSDAADISAWAEPLIFGMEADKYVGGMGNGKFLPKSSITRAQVVTMIDNAVSQYYTAAGTYSDNAAPKNAGGNCAVIVKTSGVSIKGATLHGDLIIAEGVAQGEFTLDATSVSGKLLVRGGGENSIHIINSAEVTGTVSIEKVDGTVRIVSNGVVIANLEADAEVILEGTFTNVNVAQGAKVEVRGAVANIQVEAKAEIKIAKDAKVDALTVAKAAEGTKIEVSGIVTKIMTEAPKTEIIAKETAKITTLVAETTATGTNVSIDGKAEIKTLDTDASITTSGDGTPKTVTGSGKVTQNESSSSGGGGGGGGGTSGDEPNAPGGIADTTAPVITRGDVTRISSTAAIVKFTSNEAGMYYISVVGHNSSAPVINTSGSGTACSIGENTITLNVDGSAKDIHIKVKDAAGNISDKIVAEIPEYLQYGVLRKFTSANGIDNAKISLYQSGYGIETKYFAFGFESTLSRGQIIGYRLNDAGGICSVATSGYIYAGSGFIMQSESVLRINGSSYDISSDAVVYAYDGTTPGAATCNYDAYRLDNIYTGHVSASPVSIYVDSNSKVKALLIPQTLIKVFAPAGLVGVAPTSSANNDGMITGTSSDMEYKLSTASSYSLISGNTLTGLSPGTYYVRYKAAGANPASPSTTVVVPAFVAANKYGLIIDFTPPTYFDNLRIKLYEANDVAHSYYTTKELTHINVVQGEIIRYGLDINGDIGSISTLGAVYANSGMVITDTNQVNANGSIYDIANDVTVFTYTGVSPHTATAYGLSSIANITGKSIVSSSSIYLNEDGDVAILLVPIGTVQNNQTGVKRIEVISCAKLSFLIKYPWKYVYGTYL